MARQNASVKRFQRVMASLPKEVEARALAVIAAQAESLAAAIRAAAPVGTGALRGSVKVVKGKRPLSFYVVAGGRATTPGRGTFGGEFRDALAKSPRGLAAGLTGQGLYDYARAVEFGAAGRPPEPFFFPVYRKLRKPMKRYLAEQCAAALKKGFDNA
ncbi:MAG: hypothetical protein JWM36_4341 [Hyphomicrobiales bacterium]|nr:hypothetical protein [Hyphomicrobiales bacterium]